MIKIYKYQDRKKQYRWKAVARNGRIIADCGEGYNSAQARDKGLDLLLHANCEFIYTAPPTKRK